MYQSIINSKIKPFNATAFSNGDFVEVSEADVAGKWSVFFFYPADFTFVCPTELGDMADHYSQLQEMGVEVYSYPLTHILPIKHGTTVQTLSTKFNIQ